MNKPLHSIPNRDGFKLQVRDQDGNWHNTKVVLKQNGNHYLDLPDGVRWSSLIDWRDVEK